MTLIEFYKRVLENLKLSTDKEGYIYTGTGNDKAILTIDNGKSLVLPLPEQISTIYGTDEHGEPVATKSLFNPLNEDVIKGDSIAITRMKRIIEVILSYRLATIAELLFRVYATPDLQKSTTTIINQFLSGIKELGISTSVKKVIDDSVFANWFKLYTTTQKTKDRFITIFLKKRGKLDGKVYNRLAVLNSNLYEELCNWEKDEDILGIKLRSKEVKLFKFAFEYILPEMDDNLTICIGSNDTNSPTFISLMSLYVRVTKRMNKILNAIKDVDPEKYQFCYVDNLLTEEEIADVDQFDRELAVIPSDIDINREATLPTSPIEQPTLEETVKPKLHRQQAIQEIRQQQPYPSEPVPVQTKLAPAGEEDDLAKLRAAIGPTYNAPMPQQVVPMGIPIPQQQMSPLSQPPAANLPSPDQLVQMQQRRQQQQAYQQQLYQQQLAQQQLAQQQMMMQQPMYQQQPAYGQPMMYQQPVYQQQPMFQQQPYQPPMTGVPSVPRSAPSFGQPSTQVPAFGQPQTTAQPNISNPSGYWRS